MQKKAWILISFFTVILIFLSWKLYSHSNATETLLSKNEAQKLIQDRYQGKVLQIKLTNQQYLIDLNKDNHIYRIKLDAVSGQVLSFKRNNSTQGPPETEPTKPPSDSPTTPGQQVPTKKLTESEAKQIATREVQGTIKHVQLETNEGVEYYLVEIETNEGLKAVVQINAITGKVTAISWDDHKKEDMQKDKKEDN
ncbi:PepSY domain-containing protein [Neobacillus sp. LXY-1]|uniref:PepSY domain-containing protein n=1 Tax=Neobacillus sp. LXY-1 TaxID=3379133 RepID=UPI003EE34030